MDDMNMNNAVNMTDADVLASTPDALTPEIVPEVPQSSLGDALKGAAPGLIGFIVGAVAAYGYHKYQQNKMKKDAEETK